MAEGGGEVDGLVEGADREGASMDSDLKEEWMASQLEAMARYVIQNHPMK